MLAARLVPARPTAGRSVSAFTVQKCPLASRLYDLSSTWTFPNTRQEVWDVVADLNMAWQHWWSGCTQGKPLERESGSGTTNDELLRASTATLNFKASLGYTLSVGYHPTHAETLKGVTFNASRDLAGEGRVAHSSTRNGQTKMDIEWRVCPPAVGWHFSALLHGLRARRPRSTDAPR